MLFFPTPHSFFGLQDHLYDLYCFHFYVESTACGMLTRKIILILFHESAKCL